MSDNNNTQAAEMIERKPPTLADIVREKTDDGRRIIDFFIDVMEDRVDGAELCHRMDAAKELKKHKSGAAARFIDRYSGVPCRHILRRRPHDPNHSDGADPAPSVEVPAPFSNNLLSVLSAVDEHLMTMLVRAQTAHGDTIVEFLDDVMQNRIDGFKAHHRIAAAKELALHIVRDETPAPTAPGGEPAPAKAGGPAKTETQTGGGVRSAPANVGHPNPAPTAPGGEPAPAKAGVPVKTGTQRGGGARGATANVGHPNPAPMAPGGEPAPAQAGTHPAHTEPVEATPSVVPAQAGTHPTHTEHSAPVVPAKTGSHSVHTEATSPVIPAQAGTHPTHPEPVEATPSVAPAQAGTHPRLPSQPRTNNQTLRTLPTRKPRRIRRQEGDAKARMRREATPGRSPP